MTNDPHSNLFICGFGRGGRLGFGEEQNVQFTFRPLLPPLLPMTRVERVALGQDHTVAVLHGGEVWTWGNNQFGQLGYPLPQKTSKEESIQATPRQILSPIKCHPIIGCAASKIHTAVFTKDTLYTFGRNDGQLGILGPSNAAVLEVQCTPRKVSAKFLSGAKIRDVVAIDKATAVLLECHEVWVLANHVYSRISFPTERVVGMPAGANAITRITGGGDTLCALSELGSVFAVDVDLTLKERAARAPGTGGKIAWAPQRAWSMRKRHMAVRDVAVGAEGNIIICTQSGSVWRRVKRTKAKEGRRGGREEGRFKFDRVPGLTRITTVRSNTAGAFAAVRKDSDIMRKGLSVEPERLQQDVSKMLCFKEFFEEVGIKELHSSVHGWTGIDDETFGLLKRRRGLDDGTGEWFMCDTVVEDLKSRLLELEHHRGLGDWDMLVSTRSIEPLDIPVHSIILSRSPILRRLITRGSDAAPSNICSVVPTERGLKVVFRHVGLLALLTLVYYLYTDTVIDIWHPPHTNKYKQLFYSPLQHEVGGLASALHLRALDLTVTRMCYVPLSMCTGLRTAYADPCSFRTADMVIDTADDQSIEAHSALMRVRCPFFDALYGGRASGRWLIGRRPGESELSKIHVDMKHVKKDVMGMVVSWLYYDWDADEFDKTRVGVDEDVDQFLDFVLDVLSTSNELMLERLSQVCQQVIGRLVNVRNAAGLLTAVAPYSERGFKEKCLLYISANLETMLGHR